MTKEHKYSKIKYLYIVLDGTNNPLITKYLTEVQEKTNISSNTLSKYFSRTDSPYKNNFFTIYKSFNLKLISKNKGNLDNFVSS